MTFTVVYDACVLYPAPLRDLLVRTANTGIVQAIIAFNLDDFPKTSLATYNIEPAHPDDFIYDNIDLAPATMARVITEQSASLKNPPRTIAEVLDTLRDLGLVQSVARLRELFV